MDLYQQVTDKLIAGLEQATRYQQPWLKIPRQLPTNAITGRPYSGVNILLLMTADSPSQKWATYKAWSAAGAQVRKGEKGTPIVFWKKIEADGDDEDSHGYLVARQYFVFSAEQVDGWKNAPTPRPASFDPLPAAEAFVAATGASIAHGYNRAAYCPGTDGIQMPDRGTFTGTDTRSPGEAYYGLILHELTHWTGSTSRCDRDLSGRFGSQSYAAEELVAELGAAFLSAELGITAEPRADHAQYLAAWLKLLQSDKRAIFTAASKAEQAARYLRGLQPQALAIAA
jgi:antirestriction protein ArdC